MANLMEDDMDGFGVVYVFLQHKNIYIWCFKWVSFIFNEVWKRKPIICFLNVRPKVFKS
jgi:hypothetical protein